MSLVNEKAKFKIDAGGRVVIPAALRKKFDLNAGDRVDYYTVEIDGEIYIAFKKAQEE